MMKLEFSLLCAKLSGNIFFIFYCFMNNKTYTYTPTWRSILYFLSFHTFPCFLRKRSKNDIFTLLGTMLKVSTFKLILNLVQVWVRFLHRIRTKRTCICLFKELAHGIIKADKPKICRVQYRNSGQSMI